MINWTRIVPTKYVILIVGSIWFFLLVYNCRYMDYFGWFSTEAIQSPKLPIVSFNFSIENKTGLRDNIENNGDYLIKTPGCTILNYGKKLYGSGKIPKKLSEHTPTCGRRAVFVQKSLNNSIITFIVNKPALETFNKNNGKIRCHYNFVDRSDRHGYEDKKLKYSEQEDFKNGTTARLDSEIIFVTCKSLRQNLSTTIYEDCYMFVKKKNLVSGNKSISGQNKWNVLILGLDTMSRGRIFGSMPKTVHFLKHNDWLDYRAFQKVGYNTFPNVMALLTSKKLSTIYRSCKKGMYVCNELFLWSKFKEAGYATAYGEDNLKLPDTFAKHKGFRVQPTDHYMRPLFLIGEKSEDPLVCLKQSPSGQHVLNYALDFATTYKLNNFFGFFWINSFSHNSGNNPALYDNAVLDFFTKLRDSKLLDKTFVVFMSDHGVRFGDIRYSIFSYYEERLPMLFIWTPPAFRKKHHHLQEIAVKNQFRMSTPHDVYLTLGMILSISDNSIKSETSEACPNCKSLFEIISLNRTCLEVNVSAKWCSCDEYHEVSIDDKGAIKALDLSVAYIQNYSRGVETKPCTRCQDFELQSVQRVQHFKNGMKEYYVIVFKMSPGDMAYEVNILIDDEKPSIIEPTYTITGYLNKSKCVVNYKNYGFCTCEDLPNCMINVNR